MEITRTGKDTKRKNFKLEILNTNDIIKYRLIKTNVDENQISQNPLIYQSYNFRSSCTFSPFLY